MSFVVKTKPKTTRKTPTRLIVDCSDEMQERIMTAAERANISRADFTRQAIAYALDNME